MHILQDLLKKRANRSVVIVILALVLIYILLRLTVFPTDPVLPLLDSIYKAYLIIPEWIANQLFRAANATVTIVNHELIYERESAFFSGYEKFIINWPKYLLYKRWCILIGVLIWLNTYSVKRKLIATLSFVAVHVVAVVGGLYLMGVVYPEIFQDQISVHLSPTLAGNLILYCFVAVWTILSAEELRSGISRLGIKYQPSNRQIREMVILLFFFFVLREFMIPYFQYKPYVTFLLSITEHISSWFGHSGYIEGDGLIGKYGTLGLSKHCLGFMAFYLFASFIFLTRDNLPNRLTSLYILGGLVILSILNIIRLVAIFIIVQGINGTERASLHHEIYNVAIYMAIFALWILWYERFVRRANKNA